MSLREKSNTKIKDLLTDYGIKHGPVVRSTRSLYERKLEEAMAKDKTFYREEEEEITLITYRHPRRRKTSANSITSSRMNQSSGAEPENDQLFHQLPDPSSTIYLETSAELNEDMQANQVHFASVKVSHRATSHKVVETGRPIRRRLEGKMRMLIPVVLLLTAATAGCYYTLSTVM